MWKQLEWYRWFTRNLSQRLLETANHPLNRKHGGVGLFYKNSLPINIRRDLSFEESIVVLLKFGRKKIFLTVLYRSPSFNHTSHEFQAFLLNVKNLYSKIKAENPLLLCFLQEILMLNPISGGLLAMKLLKAGKLKLCSLPLVYHR